jgi:predicted ATPase/class 3 adenylate cyclase
MPLTFLFTDLEGSSRLWEQHPAEMAPAVARHDALLRAAVEAHAGRVIKTTGDGLHAAFESPRAALLAVVAAQLALHAEPWPTPAPLRARMALHTGDAEARAGDFFGPALNRAARLMALAHGGQILLSAATAALLDDDLPPDLALRDLGEHRLRDLSRAERVYQVLHPGLPAGFPPLASADSLPNNLPAQLTSFIGRQRELAELPRLLGLGDSPPAGDSHAPRSTLHAPQPSPAARLLTLIGPGGTGKTRLSLHLAGDLLPRFPDGAWLVELAPLTEPEQVLTAAITALRLPAVPGLPPLVLLTNYLAAKRLLLLLDNCEHLVEACARLADHLLRACPRLVILASSREALGLPGEAIYRVAPLALPSDEHASPAALCRFESVELFTERAALVRPGFALSDQNAPAVAQIARRLDGIPLALELAAARLRAFSPEQIAARLDDRFRLLTGGSRAALPRQQTLRALIDWSYDLLDEDERAFLRALSVFAGGWTLEAAEALCPELPALDLLAQLADKSLVTLDDAASAAPRYRLLETVRQYARDRLFEAGEAQAARDRHLDYFLGWVVTIPRVSVRASLQDIRRFKLEHDNCLAALDWGLERDPDKALRLAGVLAEFWARREHMAQGQPRLKAALDRVAELPPVAGEAARLRQAARAKGWAGLSYAHLQVGEPARGVLALREAVRLYRAWAAAGSVPLGDPYGQHPDLATTLAQLAFVAFTANDTDLAIQSVSEAVVLARAAGDKLALAFAQGIRANWLLTQQGDLAGARVAWEESARLARESGPNFATAMSLVGLARLAAVVNDVDSARGHIHDALAILAGSDDPFALRIAQSELAHLERRAGNLVEAAGLYRECLAGWHKLGHYAAAAHEIECLAYIARAQAQPARAAHLLGAAQAARERIGTDMTPPERQEYTAELDLLRSLLPSPDLDRAWAEGRALSLDQAIALAL